MRNPDHDPNPRHPGHSPLPAKARRRKTNPDRRVRSGSRRA